MVSEAVLVLARPHVDDGGAGADPVVVMAIADREDPDAAPFREAHKVECLVTLSEIRAS